jgi:hypothetical protein
MPAASPRNICVFCDETLIVFGEADPPHTKQNFSAHAKNLLEFYG